MGRSPSWVTATSMQVCSLAAVGYVIVGTSSRLTIRRGGAARTSGASGQDSDGYLPAQTEATTPRPVGAHEPRSGRTTDPHSRPESQSHDGSEPPLGGSPTS
jgi:hypothetical protein